MDPLAEGHYRGEWISVGALHRFATIEDGKVMAAATPARHQPTSPPLVDHAYRLAGLRLTGRAVAGSTVGVKVSLFIAYGFPAPPRNGSSDAGTRSSRPRRRTPPAGRGSWSTPGRHRAR